MTISDIQQKIVMHVVLKFGHGTRKYDEVYAVRILILNVNDTNSVADRNSVQEAMDIWQVTNTPHRFVHRLAL